ncbi:MAG TPA: glycosyltransferase [Solirubrobacteraceae bacterium]|jgi:GT2 family glycosyltransferase
MISVCVAVYRIHDRPNVAGLAAALPVALGGHDGELVIALNGVDAGLLDIPSSARTLDLGINRGVAPAWNAAARAASGEVLVFCNDDVELGAGSLARLAEPLLRDHHPAIVGPVGASWDIVHGKHTAWIGPNESSREELTECDAVSGFLFACRRQTWEAVGGFDEFYAPASWEEVDFCTAVRAIGGRCYVVADVSYRHKWGVSRRQPPWARARWAGGSESWRSVHRRNKRHFLEKWATHPLAGISAEHRTLA